MKLLDMHAHLACLTESGEPKADAKAEAAGKELAFRRQHGIGTFFSCGTPEEWEFMQQLRKAESGCPRDELRGAEGECVGDELRGAEGECVGEELRGAEGECVRNKLRGAEEECVRNELWKAKSGCPGGGRREVQSGCPNLLLSFGIHPWYSDRYAAEDWMEYFHDCDAVGEIGMDSVWCDIPLPVQKKIFQCQLEIAARLGKPVILHTKGQEREIADLVRTFPGKICVHWYSGDIQTFEQFLEMDCYFTLGPDLAGTCKQSPDCPEPDSLPEDRASAALYRHMLGRIPTNSLFLETDGLGAVAWARGREKGDLQELPEVLKENLTFLAAARGMDREKLQGQMWKNLREFLGRE